MRRTLSIIGGVALGLALSQFPEYAQQYEQRLGGAVNELAAVIADFDATAAAQGLNREAALGRYAVNPDTFIVARGTDMRKTLARYEKLSAHLMALEEAGPGVRLAALAQNYDPIIAQAAFEAYQPAVPTTAEGLGMAGAGAIGGYGAMALVTAPFGRRRRRYS